MKKQEPLPDRRKAPGRRGDASTRDRIFQAAAELFAQHPYSDVSMRSIATAVGIKSPSIYSYYASKEEIFEELVGYCRRRLLQLDSELEQSLAQSGDARAKLQRIVLSYLPDTQGTMYLLMQLVFRNQFWHPIAREIVQRRSLECRIAYLTGYVAQLRRCGEIRGSGEEAFYIEALVRLNISYALEFVLLESEHQADLCAAMWEQSMFFLDKIIG